MSAQGAYHWRAAFDAPDDGDLAVVLCHFNPCAFQAPVRNLSDTLVWLADFKVPVYAVELRCGLGRNKPPVLPNDSPHVLQLESDSVIFSKENLWNIAASRLPVQYTKVLCLDADVILSDLRWPAKVADLLSQHRFIQPFARARWADSAGAVYRDRMSSAYAYCTGAEGAHVASLFHPGFAIGAIRSLWTEGPALYERDPLGGGMSMLISALMASDGQIEPTLEGLPPTLRVDYEVWASAAVEWAAGSIGYLDCDATHLWHGTREKRGFKTRVALLEGFDPNTDLKAAPPYGLLEWSAFARSSKPGLITRIAGYFSARDEDEAYFHET